MRRLHASGQVVNPGCACRLMFGLYSTYMVWVAGAVPVRGVVPGCRGGSGGADGWSRRYLYRGCVVWRGRVLERADAGGVR